MNNFYILLLFIASIIITDCSGRFVPFAEAGDKLPSSPPTPSFQEHESSIPTPSLEEDLESVNMKNKILQLVSGWRQMKDEDRLEFFRSKSTPKKSTQMHKEDVAEASTKIYDGLDFYSYYSYLSYYPTMSWFLDKTPDDDNYWVGIYNVKETNNRNYLAYSWVGSVAQGSYRIGQLSTTNGLLSSNRHEEFELRIFKGGYNRVTRAVSNRLNGVVRSPPIKVSSKATIEDIEKTPKIDSSTKAFIMALEEVSKLSTSMMSSVQYSQQDLDKL